MKVGDLVQLSAKAWQLQWVRNVIIPHSHGEIPLYGVIVMKRTVSKKSEYKVHWFHKNGLNFCDDYVLYYRELLKHLK